MTKLSRIFLLLSLLITAACDANTDTNPPLVMAAASMQESLNEAADRWAAQGRERPVLSFAGSSALARQIVAGAPADLFISADEAWMDAVEAEGMIVPETRVSFLANRLVLIAPVDSDLELVIGADFPLVRALGNGRLAMANPDAVPAGKYGRAALESLSVWREVAPKVVSADNVRGALAYVERGETPAGIVYATDAMASADVRVVDVFPAESHPPITYLVARLTSGDSTDAEPFRRFLVSPEGRAIFARYGFVVN